MANIDGTSGADTLNGTIGDDVINGLGGNDTITGGDGMDTIDGGDGNDTIDGGLGDDTLIGGDGNDSLIDNNGVNSFDGGAGDDTIYTSSVDNGQVIHGGAGNDTIRVTNGSANDIVDGGDDNDDINVDGNSTNATITGGAGNDAINSGASNSSISGGTGTDTIFVSGGGNTVTEDGTGFITVFGGNNTVTTKGGNDSVTFYGFSGPNTASTGAGNDTLTVLQGTATLTGGADSDTFRIATDGNATVTITDFTAGVGGDVVDVGYILNNAVGYPGGNPFGSGFLSLVQSGSDTQLMWDRDAAGSAYTPIVLATLQNVTVASLIPANFGGYDPSGGPSAGSTITGTSGADTLTGTIGDDVINGLGGNDTITGGDGSDTIDGGDGTDSIDGGLGNDTLTGGDGNDSLTDNYGVNSFDGGAGDDYITTASTQAGQVIHGGAGNDTIRVTNGSANDIVDGGDDNDDINVDGNSTNATITGGAGNDAINSGASNSSISGGTGTDTIFVSGGGNTVTEDGTGFITVFGGNNTVTTKGGNDSVTFYGFSGPNTASTGAGNDTLTVLQGTATLTGGADSDTFRIATDGNATVTITDFTAGVGGDVVDVGYILNNAVGYPGGNPFGSGFLSLVQSGSDTQLMWDRDAAGSAYTPIVLATLQNVTVASLIPANFGGYDPSGGPSAGSTITGTSGADTLTGTIGDDVINGLGGNDTITGGDGSDTIDGGDGTDSIDGGLGNDTLTGGDGNDSLTDNYGVNSFDGGAGDDYITTASTQAGQVIHGGAGNDTIRVTNGNGSANDIVDGGDDNDDINVDGNSTNATITGGAGNDAINSGASNSSISGGTGTDTIFVSGGGNTVTEDGTGFITVFGGNNTVTTKGGNDSVTFYGFSGPNTASTGAGNDTLTVLQGTATLTGGAGRDTYKLAGDSIPTVSVTDFTVGAGGDTLDIAYVLLSAIGYPGGNPFGRGFLSLVQSGSDTQLMWDRDASGSSYSPIVLVTLQHVTSTALTAANLGGYNPNGGASPPVGDFSDVTVNEDGALSATATATDVDSTVLTYAVVTGPAHGALIFGANGSYTYTPTANYNGADSFTFKANDGALDSEPATVSITVVSVNDAPSGTGATISTHQNEARVLTVADFGYGDVDGNALLSVKIASVPLAGTFALNGIAVTAGQFVAASEIVAGHLAFTPATGAIANGYASFTFQVRDDGGTANGGADLDATPRTLTVNVLAPDVPAVAAADTAGTTEAATSTISVLGNDSDPDGPALAIASVNGAAIAVGGHATLASGAIVTLNADGTLGYDPNHRFDYLVSAATGAATGAMSMATDSFVYALVGGGSATVTVTIDGVDGAGDQLRGDAGDNTITGTAGSDYFDLSQGGDDTIRGGDGNDGFYFGAAFTGTDRVDGEAGTNDQVGLQGNYTGGNALVLQAATIAGVETIAVLPGFDYNITTVDANVAAGQVLTIYGSQLGAGDDLTFNGSAETDGMFKVFGGRGADNITTGGGNDGIYFGAGRFDVTTDHVDGGGGTNDQLALDGTYTGLTIARANVVNVETLVLLDGQVAPADYSITLADDWTTGAEVHTVFAVGVRNGVTIDGHLETTSMLRFYGGAGNDTLIGGSAGNWFDGGAGADTMTGGAGVDTFSYTKAVNSMGVNYDRIVGFDQAQDKIHLPVTVSDIDAAKTGTLSTASFDSDLTAALATLGANHAVQFTATGGSLDTHVFEVIDVNGVAGYQAGQDMVIELVDLASGPITTTTPFI